MTKVNEKKERKKEEDVTDYKAKKNDKKESQEKFVEVECTKIVEHFKGDKDRVKNDIVQDMAITDDSEDGPDISKTLTIEDSIAMMNITMVSQRKLNRILRLREIGEVTAEVSAFPRIVESIDA